MELEQGNVRRATRLSLCRFAWGWAAVCTAKQHRGWLCGLLSSRVRPLEASAKLTFAMLSPCVRTVTLLSLCVCLPCGPCPRWKAAAWLSVGDTHWMYSLSTFHASLLSLLPSDRL